MPEVNFFLHHFYLFLFSQDKKNVSSVLSFFLFLKKGYFLATRKAIHRQSKSLFELIHSYQKYPMEEVDHYIERTWAALLHYPRIECNSEGQTFIREIFNFTKIPKRGNSNSLPLNQMEKNFRLKKPKKSKDTRQHELAEKLKVKREAKENQTSSSTKPHPKLDHQVLQDRVKHYQNSHEKVSHQLSQEKADSRSSQEKVRHPRHSQEKERHQNSQEKENLLPQTKKEKRRSFWDLFLENLN